MVNVWSNFTEQPILAIESGTCSKVIADLTCCLQQCIQEQLTHLDNRARALAASGNFEAALEDVARIRQLGPFSAVGYLCAGHVYSLQGRQKAAIDIYDQGLAAIPLSDPSHQQLVEARSMAQERDSTRIDFIKELPIDIIENIAPWILSEGEMKPREIRGYLDVSSVWRGRLLTCIRELRIESTSKDDLADDVDLLEQVAPCCTALTFDDNATGFPQLILKTPFPSLQTLIAPYARYDDYDDDEDYNLEIAALVSLGSTLTHLEIGKSEYGVCFGEILSSCPNLVYLETYDVDPDMANGPKSHPNLRRLLFWTDEDESVDIHDITKRLPELELFVTKRFYDTKAFKIIQDNCPNLKAMGCNEYGITFYGPTTATPTTTRSQNHGDQQDCIGVHLFFVECQETNIYSVDLKDIMDFMRRNSHTLEQVRFYIDLHGGDNDARILNRAIQTADGALFKSLTTFSNCIYDHDSILLTRWIARESPHLRKLELLRDYYHSLGPADTSALFDDLIGCCELESVNFALHGDPTMDMGGVERLIQHHSTFDSLLHTLILPQNIRLPKDALHALTKLPRLEDLSISWPWLKEEDQEDGKCSDFIGKLDRLQRLEIRCDEVIPDDVVVQLAKLNITSLKLRFKPISKSSELMVLFSLLQCPNLQELFVRCSLPRKDESLIEEIRNMLKTKIEEVNFNTYYR